MSDINKIYIGQLNGTGLRTDLKPYAIPDEAFAELNNVCIYRGRVKKRFGARLMRGTDAPYTGFEQFQSRLRINLGNSDASGNCAALALPSTAAILPITIGAAFSIAGQMFTVYQVGGANDAMYSTGIAAGEVDTVAATNTVTVTGNNLGGAVPVYYYPALPVMGLETYSQPAVNEEKIVAFDTRYAYQYGVSGWERLSTGGANAVWSGDDANYFWGENWQGPYGALRPTPYLFVTNFNFAATAAASDSIRYLDSALQWNTIGGLLTAPAGTTAILTSRCILSFENRLLLFNVVEYNTGTGATTQYANRVRWSQAMNPTDATAWYDVGVYGGGRLDATTDEAIVTVEYINNKIIVYFESSTWELVYTNNTLAPFIWQKINTELGAESTFSQVPFDKVVLGVGNVGIHACNGVNVERIDEAIPQLVFNIHNDNSGPERVAGIRDYYGELVYWAMPDQNRTSDDPYNNKILTYNYQNNTWALYDDSIMCFGYYQNILASAPSSLTWGETTQSWESADFIWGSGTIQSKFKNILAGNQEGYVFIVFFDDASNCPALQITDMDISLAPNYAVLTVINHNLSVGDYVKISNCIGITDLNNQIFQVGLIVNTSDEDTVVLNLANTSASGTYKGGGTLTRVTPVDFKTKQFNFFAKEGRSSLINKVDFLVDKTSQGSVTVDCLMNSSLLPMAQQAQLTGTNTSSLILNTYPYSDLYPMEGIQSILWHPVYYSADGEYVQFYFYLNNVQATTVGIAEANFQLHAMIVHTRPSRLLL